MLGEVVDGALDEVLELEPNMGVAFGVIVAVSFVFEEPSLEN